MFKPNGDQSWKRCPKCKKQGVHICGYDKDVFGNPVAVDQCQNCNHISEWDDEAKDDQTQSAH